VADCNLIAFRRVFQKLCRERQPASPVRIFASSVGIAVALPSRSIGSRSSYNDPEPPPIGLLKQY
jgi:hypothetical protein